MAAYVFKAMLKDGNVIMGDIDATGLEDALKEATAILWTHQKVWDDVRAITCTTVPVETDRLLRSSAYGISTYGNRVNDAPARCDACKCSHTDNYPNCKAKAADVGAMPFN